MPDENNQSEPENSVQDTLGAQTTRLKPGLWLYKMLYPRYIFREPTKEGVTENKPEKHLTHPRCDNPEMRKAFDKWIERHDASLDYLQKGHCIVDAYKKACEYTEGIKEISYRDIDLLLREFNPLDTGKEKSTAGLFFSALYNRLSPRIIAFSGDFSDIFFLGTAAGENTVVVNNGAIGLGFCLASNGVAINNGWTDDYFGCASTGLIINNNITGYDFANRSNGHVAALKEPIGYGNLSCARVKKPEDLEKLPELKQYLEELCETTRNVGHITDEEKTPNFIEKYSIPSRTIREDLFGRRSRIWYM